MRCRYNQSLPAITVKSSYFKEIQGPFGPLKLMAVGGISEDNLHDFLTNGASYAGLGSRLFKKEDLVALNIEGLHQSLANLVKEI